MGDRTDAAMVTAFSGWSIELHPRAQELSGKVERGVQELRSLLVSSCLWRQPCSSENAAGTKQSVEKADVTERRKKERGQGTMSLFS